MPSRLFRICSVTYFMARALHIQDYWMFHGSSALKGRFSQLLIPFLDAQNVFQKGNLMSLLIQIGSTNWAEAATPPSWISMGRSTTSLFGPLLSSWCQQRSNIACVIFVTTVRLRCWRDHVVNFDELSFESLTSSCCPFQLMLIIPYNSIAPGGTQYHPVQFGCRTRNGSLLWCIETHCYQPKSLLLDFNSSLEGRATSSAGLPCLHNMFTPFLARLVMALS